MNFAAGAGRSPLVTRPSTSMNLKKVFEKLFSIEWTTRDLHELQKSFYNFVFRG